MSKLLIEEPPLQVLPSLAKAIGLNEAIIVQQIHYWMVGKQGKIHDGKRWIYNSYPKWQEQFPFWSRATIQRAFTSAEAQGVITSRQASGFDRQKWYTIDYVNLESSIVSKCDDGRSQNDTVSSYQNATVLTETTQKITTESTTSRGKPTRATDTRAAHPAILAFRETTNRYPPKVNFDRVISALGETPDLEKLKSAYEGWCARGYNPGNLNWLEWYKTGVPVNGNGKGGKGQGFDVVMDYMAEKGMLNVNA